LLLDSLPIAILLAIPGQEKLQDLTVLPGATAKKSPRPHVDSVRFDKDYDNLRKFHKNFTLSLVLIILNLLSIFYLTTKFIKFSFFLSFFRCF